MAGDPAGGDWVAVKALAVLAGASDRAAAAITTEADLAGLTGSQRNGADRCVRYLGSEHGFLRYDLALEAGRRIDGRHAKRVAVRQVMGTTRWCVGWL
ncbi:MAG TPA: hypothetical protein VK817_22465 [Trebonia sp.]|nr:hypothetical protein [Trebonia sp.]